MYLTIILLPLLSGLINGLIGRKIGKSGSLIIMKLTITLSTILGIIGYYEIIIRNTSVIIEIIKMIETENITIS
jgi:NADH-ubiquinone oxidoreductase chain 5